MSLAIIQRLLTPNPYSRPGTKVDKILALIMHWTAVPGQPAAEVVQFYEDRKGGRLGFGSAHYIVGQDGTIYQCIPETEMAYHVGSAQADPVSGKVYTDWARLKFGPFASNPNETSPNHCTLGIEMCPVDAAGQFTEQTLSAAAELAKAICLRHGLTIDSDDIATHNMVVGWKDCPRYWVRIPSELTAFRQRVRSS